MLSKRIVTALTDTTPKGSIQITEASCTWISNEGYQKWAVCFKPLCVSLTVGQNTISWAKDWPYWYASKMGVIANGDLPWLQNLMNVVIDVINATQREDDE